MIQTGERPVLFALQEENKMGQQRHHSYAGRTAGEIMKSLQISTGMANRNVIALYSYHTKQEAELSSTCIESSMCKQAI